LTQFFKAKIERLSQFFLKNNKEKLKKLLGCI